MPAIPCCTHILCPGGGVGPNSLEFDSPLANLSSELPDQDVFIGQNFGYARYSQPFLGSNWTRNSCLGICTSTVSQQAANDCAARNNLICVTPSWGVPPGTGNNGGPSSGPPLIPAPPGINPQLQLNLNQSCTANCNDPESTPFTWTVAAGTFIAENQLLANQMAFSRACQLAVVNIICMSDPAACCCGTPYSGVINVTGSNGPFSISGNPPTGLGISQSADGSKVFLSGTIGSPGNQQFTLTATDANGNFQTKTFILKVLCVSGSPGQAIFGQAYSFNFTGGGGDGGPYSFLPFQPPPPPGLVLDPSGLLHGTPSQVGTFTFGVGITDKNGNTCGTSVTMQVLGVTNNPQTGSYPCPNNGAIVVSSTVPAGSVNYPVGTPQQVADAAASQMLLNQLNAALKNSGCTCAGVNVTNGVMSNPGCPTGAEACCQVWVSSCQGNMQITSAGVDPIHSCDVFVGNANRPRGVTMTLPGFVSVSFYAT